MDSLRRLSSEGMIAIVPQVGSVVATYQPHEVQDFFLMFGGFEGSIAAVAAQRRTPAQLEMLVEVADECVRILDIPDPNQRARPFRLSYRRFHNVVHDMAHSGIMATTSQKLWDLSDFLIGTVGGISALTQSMDERENQHDLIRQAISAGDSEAAERAMTEHIRSAAHFLNQVPRT
jgi:DNA-binding GntR family transcriptional regulator